MKRTFVIQVEYPDKVYIGDDSYYFIGNSMLLHPDNKYKTTVYFE